MKPTRSEFVFIAVVFLVIMLSAWQTYVFEIKKRQLDVLIARGAEKKMVEVKIYELAQGITIRAYGKMSHCHQENFPHGFYGTKGKATMSPEFIIANRSAEPAWFLVLAKSGAITLMEYRFKIEPATEFNFHLDPTEEDWRCSIIMIPKK